MTGSACAALDEEDTAGASAWHLTQAAGAQEERIPATIWQYASRIDKAKPLSCQS